MLYLERYILPRHWNLIRLSLVIYPNRHLTYHYFYILFL